MYIYIYIYLYIRKIPATSTFALSPFLSLSLSLSLFLFLSVSFWGGGGGGGAPRARDPTTTGGRRVETGNIWPKTDVPGQQSSVSSGDNRRVAREIRDPLTRRGGLPRATRRGTPRGRTCVTKRRLVAVARYLSWAIAAPPRPRRSSDPRPSTCPWSGVERS